MPVVRRRAPQAKRFLSGAWKGVRTTTDPLDDPPDLLVDAYNGYVPDPINLSGWYARPGFDLENSASPLATGTFRGQGVFSHHDLSGTAYNFIVAAGKLFRVDGTFSTFTDVTPVGVTIDSGITTRVYGTSFLNNLVVTDGVHRPWIATNLSSTPITGTYIDFDGSGTAWIAFGPAVIYGGAVFFILTSYNGVAARTDIAWSAPGDPATGYQQNPYDNRWTLAQTATDQLYALAGTNIGLYYFRSRSIGVASGVVGPNFATTSTQDSVSVNVGTQAPQSIVQFGAIIYFTDAMGRPFRLVQGSSPEPIWLQMRAILDANTIGFPAISQYTTTATFEPTLNLYLVAVFSCVPSQQGPAVEMYAFDARTGNYVGRWTVNSGCQIDCLGNFVDTNGRGTLIVVGSKVPPTGSTLAAGGYVWALNALTSSGDFLTTEDGTMITTEDGVFVTSEGTPASWSDNSSVPDIRVTTGHLGYDIDAVLNADTASVLVGSLAPVAISAQTSALALTVEATPTPNASSDSIYRATVGLDGVQGRGVEITVAPTTATAQWSIQQVAVKGVLSQAGPDE